MDWNAVADAVTATADTVPEINGYSEVPDDLANIGFYVGEIDVDFDVTFRRVSQGGVRRGTDSAMVTGRVLVARFDDKGAQRKLRAFMSGSGPTSLIQAFANNKTLGGTVDSSHVKSMKGNRLFNVGEAKFYGVELSIFVVGEA